MMTRCNPRTRVVELATVHIVPAFTRGGGTVVADPDDFMVHHHRRVSVCGASVCNNGTSTDGMNLTALVRDDAMGSFVKPVERAATLRKDAIQRHADECQRV